MSSYFMTKYCVSAPSFSASVAPPSPTIVGPVAARNNFAPSASSPAVVDSGTQGQTATLNSGAQATPRGIYFPAGTPYVAFPSFQFGGTDVTLGAETRSVACIGTME